MSSKSTADSDSSTLSTTDQQFSWKQLTLRARGPVERVQRLDADWTMRADVELDLARRIEGASDFQAIALSAGRIHGTANVVDYLLQEIDHHHLPEHSMREAWSITIEGEVGDWVALARAAEDGYLSYPLDGATGLELLRSAAEEGVADPNCLLALVQWAERRGADSTRDEWLTRYQQRVNDDADEA